MFREAPAPLGGGRNLILDVYDEGCREFFFAARADVRYLLAALDQVRKERDELMVDRERLDRQVILAVDDYNEMKARSETAEREREEARANEKELSAAYLRIRQLVGAWDTNHGGENRFEVTEKKIRDLISQLPPSP
jgi:chromosome segregation ATPase